MICSASNVSREYSRYILLQLEAVTACQNELGFMPASRDAFYFPPSHRVEELDSIQLIKI